MMSEPPPKRPQGSNADEWRLFLSAYVDSRATIFDGLSFVAVQIAEAIEGMRERCAKCAESNGATMVGQRIAADIRNL
jgi:hypothetical protein